jgi:uncharacterized membrane protein
MGSNGGQPSGRTTHLHFREGIPRGGDFSESHALSRSRSGGVSGAKGAEQIAHVFVSNPPVPTTGTFIAVRVEDLLYLDMPVETALKLIVSGGIVTPTDVVPMSDAEAKRRRDAALAAVEKAEKN